MKHLKHLKHLKTFESFSIKETNYTEEELIEEKIDAASFTKKDAEYTKLAKGKKADKYKIAASVIMNTKKFATGVKKDGKIIEYRNPVNKVDHGALGKSSGGGKSSLTIDEIRTKCKNDGFDIDSI